MKSTIKKKSLFMLLLLFAFCLRAAAQIGDPDEDEDGEGSPLAPGAPIDDYVVPMMVLGIATGYFLMRKKEKILP